MHKFWREEQFWKVGVLHAALLSNLRFVQTRVFIPEKEGGLVRNSRFLML